MKVAVFHGSPRKGNTYRATRLFLDEMARCGEVQLAEFFFPADLPQFCMGCQLCLSGPREKCPHAQHVTPILHAILEADALVFTTPHFGGCSMSSSLKNLLDHLDFLTMNVAPRTALFSKKAFILTTATGSTAAIGPIRKFLKNWGVNRVYALGLRMFTNKWNAMPQKKQAAFERRLRRAARQFYAAPIGRPYLSTAFMYHMSKLVLRRYVGEGAYPYQYWTEQGFFDKRPF